MIQTNGSTSLTEVANNYFLYNGGTGPELKYGSAAVMAGQFGSWNPLVRRRQRADTKWPGKSPASINMRSGAPIAAAIFSLSAPSYRAAVPHWSRWKLPFIRTLNGDGVIGIPSSAASATMELAGASSDSFTFTGTPGVLKLDTPSTFSGQIVGFTGDGMLMDSDRIDLRGMSFIALHSSYNNFTCTLDVSDAATTADIKFAGTNSQANFKFADDGNGGTFVYGSSTPTSLIGASNDTAVQIATNSLSNHSVNANQNSFVFASNFGQVTVANFNPTTDFIQISRSIFSNITDLLAATYDDGHGKTVIAADTHNTITLQQVTIAQLQAHQSDFHFV